jgi:hypothetical protein
MNSETELQFVGSIDSGVLAAAISFDLIRAPTPEEADNKVKAESEVHVQPSGVGMDDVEVYVSVKKQVDDDRQDGQAKYAWPYESQTITSPPTNPPGHKTKLDYIVIAIILIAAIIFGAFQIRECATAHSNPGTVSRSMERARVYPGLMICPYTTPETFIGPPDYCPDWDKDASLSFNYGGNPPRAFNTNVNFRESGRQQSVCKMNIKKSSPSITSTGAWLPLFFGKLAPANSNNDPDMSFAREAIIKNSPDGDTSNAECQEGKCVTSTCLTWTPPNVKCLVYDPIEFDNLAEKNGIDPKCNPMKETVPNSFDSFQLAINIPDILVDSNYAARDPNQGFQYEGLIPQEKYVGSVDEAPSRFVSMYDMQARFKSGIAVTDFFTMNATFFGGLMVVLYDPTEGIPKQMDFNSAPLIVDNNEGSFKVSQMLISKNFNFLNLNSIEYKYTKPIGPIVVAVDSAIQKTFTNAVLNEMRDIMKYFLSFSYSIDKKNDFDSRRFDISLQFVSSQLTLTEEVVKISILTTISIILSTTATLWGARENIAEGLILIVAKARMYLQKRK